MTASIPLLDPNEEHFRIPGPRADLRLFLRRLAAQEPGRRAVVLGPWRHLPLRALGRAPLRRRVVARCLNDAGFDVWALDFTASATPTLPGDGRTRRRRIPALRPIDAAGSVDAAVHFILERPTDAALAHRRIPGARCQPAVSPAPIPKCRSLVLFGPIARRPSRTMRNRRGRPRVARGDVEDQWKRFIEDVPPGGTGSLPRVHFDAWAERISTATLTSRPAIPGGQSAHRTVPGHTCAPGTANSVTIRPGKAPVALIRGEWDSLLPDEDARWLFDAFTASPIKRDMKIPAPHT